MEEDEKLKVEHDANACTGHGRCYVLGPEVFGEDERGHCVVKTPLVSADLLEQALLAAENCPEDAITLLDADDT